MKKLPAPPAAILAGSVLLAFTMLFWKVRIFDLGTNPTIEIGPVDLYINVAPMNVYGFGALARGVLPLWNPYQFCGEPFLAMAYVGLLYPLNAMNLWFDVLTSFEIALVLHMFFGGFSMWWLCRHFGVSVLGGLCAAVTFMWSGWMINNNILPGVFEAITWMPLTVLLVDSVLQGRRWAWLGLIAALTCQLLIGVVEILVHTTLLCGMFAACRIVQMTSHGMWRLALRGLAVCTGCSVVALLVAAPQLLPAIELTRQSARAPGALTFAQAVNSAIPPLPFLRAAVETGGVVTVGLLPLLGLVLVIGDSRHRMVAIGALFSVVVAALLVFGDPVYRLYYSIPVIGTMFRRPMKFLDIYTFGQALVVGIAVSRLEGWSVLPRRDIWRQPSWLVMIILGVTVVAWLTADAKPWWSWGAVTALLILWGCVPWPRLRTVVLISICAVQGANLFFTNGDTHVRPVKRPEIFETAADLLSALKSSAGQGRTYLSPKFWFTPGLTAKQGLWREMAVVIDYEPLAVGRYERFFERMSPRTDTWAPFSGAYELRPTSRWRLMDLTGTKYFVMLRGEPGDLYMAEHPDEFRVISNKPVRVFEKTAVLPRAFFVSRSRTLATPEAVLEGLDDPSFDPRNEVLLEAQDGDADSLPAPEGGAGAPFEGPQTVSISHYAPEQVEVSVVAPTPGLLVLHDLHYPGWRAFVGDRELPIRRANYLFRAVELPAGRSEVRFTFEPQSLRLGLLLSAGALAAVFVVLVYQVMTLRRR